MSATPTTPAWVWAHRDHGAFVMEPVIESLDGAICLHCATCNESVDVGPAPREVKVAIAHVRTALRELNKVEVTPF